MDRDCLIAHGMTKFISESMMERGDEYYMAVCNKSGTIAVYNENRNLFLSPILDGLYNIQAIYYKINELYKKQFMEEILALLEFHMLLNF